MFAIIPDLAARFVVSTSFINGGKIFVAAVGKPSTSGWRPNPSIAWLLDLVARRDAAASAENMSNWPNDETDDPLQAGERDFYKVEKWTIDGAKVDWMLYAGNNLDKAREIFAAMVRHRPRIRLTIRQRTRVLDEWPP